MDSVKSGLSGTSSNLETAPVSTGFLKNYIGAAKPGETLLIEAHTNKFGKSLAFLSVEIKTKETGKLIARGTHTKYLPGTDFNL
ncbi:unnamed protein product [Darwinula stevensoni]|uniref:Thioesterase domain-containing protein n=1 Tax=Darwinula stevensoni TaxID=69355 RepID=A0A7R8WYY6_9CRUS|nr:unnamed protein product [Darwinula stevensoni]CAG0879933.1 unnamed protein product [Darwinula stevensoni]